MKTKQRILSTLLMALLIVAMSTAQTSNGNHWGTFCYPFEINYNPNNPEYKFYTLTGVSDEALIFTEWELEMIPAGTPLAIKALSENVEYMNIFSAAETRAANASAATSDIQVGEYTMKGTYIDMTDVTDVYFIAQDHFWWAESPITIPAYHAYIEGPEPTSEAPLRIAVADGEAQSLQFIEQEDGTVRIDLHGRQINEGQKGLMIRDGRLMFVR